MHNTIAQYLRLRRRNLVSGIFLLSPFIIFISAIPCLTILTSQTPSDTSKLLTLALKPHYNHEIEGYHNQFDQGNIPQAWQHLERAHIIGQKYPFAHNYAHWKMLLFGIKTKNSKEIIGQIPRLVFGGVKSFVGKVPVGNPGAANLPPLKPFNIPIDLQKILSKVPA